MGPVRPWPSGISSTSLIDWYIRVMEAITQPGPLPEAALWSEGLHAWSRTTLGTLRRGTDMFLSSAPVDTNAFYRRFYDEPAVMYAQKMPDYVTSHDENWYSTRVYEGGSKISYAFMAKPSQSHCPG